MATNRLDDAKQLPATGLSSRYNYRDRGGEQRQKQRASPDDASRCCIHSKETQHYKREHAYRNAVHRIREHPRRRDLHRSAFLHVALGPLEQLDQFVAVIRSNVFSSHSCSADGIICCKYTGEHSTDARHENLAATNQRSINALASNCHV